LIAVFAAATDSCCRSDWLQQGTECGSVVQWLAHLEWEPGGRGRATIPLGSNLGQVVYTHCLPSFWAPRNWRTKGSFRRL